MDILGQETMRREAFVLGRIIEEGSSGNAAGGN
jgi:hypothetical protein